MSTIQDVFVIGTGQTAVGEHWGISLRHLAWKAVKQALESSGLERPDAIFVGNILAPRISQQHNLGTLLADFCGFRGVEAITVEASGASGGAAVRQAMLALRSGEIGTALVVGVEKMTDKVGPEVTAALAAGADSDWELVQGVTAPAMAALIMRRYMHDYGVHRDEFADFALNAHYNAQANVDAMFRNGLDLKQYVQAGIVASPVNIFDGAPDADGAAALVLSSEPGELRPGLSVRVASSSLVTHTLALHDRRDVLSFEAARLSAERAFQQAGITPDQIDLAELYDRFSIYAVLSLEACGFARRGEGWRLARNSGVGRNGQLPISTFGGLTARGNPGGATGVYQMVEVTRQLAGMAQDNQVAGAKWGLAQCLGSSGATAVTHILDGTNRN